MRKDSLLIVNQPLDARQVCDVTHKTLKFYEKFLGVEITEYSIKACHIIPNSGNKFLLPTVISKFIYFATNKVSMKKENDSEKKQDKQQVHLSKRAPSRI